MSNGSKLNYHDEETPVGCQPGFSLFSYFDQITFRRAPEAPQLFS